MDLDPEQIERTLRALLADEDRGLVAAYLYGSVARGTAHADSDVDVAVLLADDPPSTLDGQPLDLEYRLERALGLPVQIVTINGAPADLVHRILRDGKLLLDRDPSARVRFEVRSRNEFFDLQPILAEYRRTPWTAK